MCIQIRKFVQPWNSWLAHWLAWSTPCNLMVAGRSLSGSLMHLGHGGRARLSENVPNAMILIFAMMYASARCMELFIWILYASPRNWWGRWCGDSFATQLPTAQLEDKDEAVTGPLGPQRGKDRGDAVTHFSCSKRFCGLLAFQLQCISSCSNKIELLESFYAGSQNKIRRHYGYMPIGLL